METYLLAIGIGLLLTMLMPLYRAVAGPTAIDRMMGVNVIGTKTTVLVVIIGTVFGRVEMFVDIALAYALLNFIAVLAAARFFQHRRRLAPGPGGPRGGKGGAP